MLLPISVHGSACDLFLPAGVYGLHGVDPDQPGSRKKLSFKIEELDAVKHLELIRQYGLIVTPTILILNNDLVQERFEGVVHAEPLEAVLKKYH